MRRRRGAALWRACGRRGAWVPVSRAAVRTHVRDRSRAAGKRAYGIAAKLRMRSAQGRDEAQAVVQRITGELADLAVLAAADGEKMLVNARRALRRAQAKAAQLTAAGGADPVAGRRRGRLHRAVNDLAGCWTRPGRSRRRPGIVIPRKGKPGKGPGKPSNGGGRSAGR